MLILINLLNMVMYNILGTFHMFHHMQHTPGMMKHMLGMYYIFGMYYSMLGMYYILGMFGMTPGMYYKIGMCYRSRKTSICKYCSISHHLNISHMCCTFDIYYSKSGTNSK